MLGVMPEMKLSINVAIEINVECSICTRAHTCLSKEMGIVFDLTSFFY